MQNILLHVVLYRNTLMESVTLAYVYVYFLIWWYKNNCPAKRVRTRFIIQYPPSLMHRWAHTQRSMTVYTRIVTTVVQQKAEAPESCRIVDQILFLFFIFYYYYFILFSFFLPPFMYFISVIPTLLCVLDVCECRCITATEILREHSMHQLVCVVHRCFSRHCPRKNIEW